MKPITGLITAAVLATTLAGCDALDRLGKVEVTATSETEVQGDPTGVGALGYLGFGSDFASFDITQTSAFENNGIHRSNIGDSYVTRFYLEVTSEQDDDLSFIDSMSVYFDSDDDPNNNNETRVAYIEAGNEPKEGQRSISLTVKDESDIGDYLRQQDMYVHVQASGNPPPDDVSIRAEMDVLVNVEW